MGRVTFFLTGMLIIVLSGCSKYEIPKPELPEDIPTDVSFSADIQPTFVYYNAVPEGYRNANASIYFGGRLQVLGMSSVVFEYDQPLLMPDEDIYPNLAAGVEIATSTHAFRVFVSNYNAIVKNRGIAFNGNNPFDGDFQFGFNILIRF